MEGGIQVASLRERILGAWYGQMAGDTLGSQVEFKSAEFLHEHYPGGVRSMEPSPVFGTLAGQITDDTELAIALGHALIESPDGRYHADLAAKHYRLWLDSGPFDLGRTIGRALSGIPRWDEEAGTEGLARAAQRHADKKSQANGALMRHSILGIWGYNQSPEDVANVAREDSLLTHPHIVCQDASAVYVATIATVVREGLNAQGAYAFAKEFAKQQSLHADVQTVMEEAATKAPPWSTVHHGWVLVALHNAFYQLLHAPSLEEGIVATIMLGHDTDTNAAIAGALLGAVYGFSQMPEPWVQVLDHCRPAPEPGCFRPRAPIYWPANAQEFLKQLGVLPPV
ncbi:MAG: ribosylglycohydrolase [Sulfobacillus thermosulfidooxidans]|uniref:Ribosylglycohydrolase n=1 Tax=Sulfobacillus thermotolerans TaxID=338644 RepID=A0ABM6RRE3_9FIRM|nr:hypothetical protein BXT84_07905 [Sulfobacillus thermotolerans]PSR38008.1 MAG: ribosylglycohydrolase [Sulfobacillus thermosulfidooxidans]